LELVQLVGDAGQRLEADRVPDLAHARRVSMARDRPLDHLEDRHLLLAEALAPAGLRLLAAAGRGAGLAHLQCSCLRDSSNVGGRGWSVLFEPGSETTDERRRRAGLFWGGGFRSRRT